MKFSYAYPNIQIVYYYLLNSAHITQPHLKLLIGLFFIVFQFFTSQQMFKGRLKHRSVTNLP